MSSLNKIVLVVEDDDMLRNIIVDQLSLKYSVIAASNGEEGFQFAISQRPGIIILDLLLPKLDGFGFLKRLRESADKDFAKTAVLVVSNLSDQESLHKVNQLGILDYVVKSDIQLDFLLSRVNRFFNQGV
jgi:DNA-binding response OmpR family regulator